MRHFGRADAEGVGAERAVGRGVAVAAHDQQARQRQALFRADHMHDALTRIAQAEQTDAVCGGVGLEIGDHRRDRRIGDRAVAGVGRHVMIGNAEGEPRLGHRTSALLHLREGEERAFMHIMAVDPEQRGAVLAPRDLVRGPELVDEGLGFAHRRTI